MITLNDQKILKNAIALIEGSSNITIIGHINPDGDCIGSCMALYYLLTGLGKKCAVFADGEVKGPLVNIKNITNVLNVQPFDPLSDLVITADVSSDNRLGANYYMLNKRKVLSIDHHATHDIRADVTLLDAQAAACCEYLYELICEYDETLINDDIAYCLYVGLVTDTGNFSYSNVRSHTFEVASDLLEYNVDAADISSKMTREMSMDRFRMHSEVKSEAEFYLDGKVAFAHFSQHIFDKYHLDIQETDGVASALIEIDKVQIAFVLSDFNKGFKISCRTKKPYSAVRICERFGGGGHFNAAGCMLQGTDYFDACDKLYAAAKSELGEF